MYRVAVVGPATEGVVAGSEPHSGGLVVSEDARGLALARIVRRSCFRRDRHQRPSRCPVQMSHAFPVLGSSESL